MFIFGNAVKIPPLSVFSDLFDSVSAVVPGGHACRSLVVSGNGFSGYFMDHFDDVRNRALFGICP